MGAQMRHCWREDDVDVSRGGCLEERCAKEWVAVLVFAPFGLVGLLLLNVLHEGARELVSGPCYDHCRRVCGVGDEILQELGWCDGSEDGRLQSGHGAMLGQGCFYGQIIGELDLDLY